MGKIYVGQTNLRIVLNVGQDITGATSLIIKYIKPNEETVKEWTAAILGVSTNGDIYYDIFPATVLDQAGGWGMWSHVTFSDGSVGSGEIVYMTVYEEGT